MLYLHGAGHFNPENVLSNKFLEELNIGTTTTVESFSRTARIFDSSMRTDDCP